ncbi:MAG: hypothetical protein IJ350_04335, partial [Clostridia bacterium]|nr:hypothetical protein [Clostridia bacterium]
MEAEEYFRKNFVARATFMFLCFAADCDRIQATQGEIIYQQQKCEEISMGIEKKEQGFVLNEKTGYFQHHGVDVMAFDDIYPAG